MTSFGLPWIFGPVPIVLTIWSAIVFGKTVRSRRALKIGSGNIVSSFMLSIGIVSTIIQISYPNGGFITSILSQIASSLLCCAVANIVNYYSLESGDFPRKDLSISASFRIVLVGISVFSIINTVYFILPKKEYCNDSRCYTSEYLFGRQDEIFQSVYLGNLGPSVFLTISIFVIWESLRRFLSLSHTR